MTAPSWQSLRMQRCGPAPIEAMTLRVKTGPPVQRSYVFFHRLRTWSESGVRWSSRRILLSFQRRRRALSSLERRRLGDRGPQPRSLVEQPLPPPHPSPASAGLSGETFSVATEASGRLAQIAFSGRGTPFRSALAAVCDGAAVRRGRLYPSQIAIWFSKTRLRCSRTFPGQPCRKRERESDPRFGWMTGHARGRDNPTSCLYKRPSFSARFSPMPMPEKIT